ncbi:uncharacterized protein [Gossypium hirsutum]|uniref:G-patch domain-containing protein n=1 Tax=Gossypium hirsutum TaxID=3635 RepID=A0ABM2ZI26_GOSHI|nr:uncharacterized protein LOC121213595 [Gossypium hirsutum]
MSYKDLYQRLFDAYVVAPHYLKPLQLPYLNWYDASAQCDYHTGTIGHSIENYIAFKKLVEKLIGMGVAKLDDSPNAENPFPNHNEVNMMSGNMGRNVKIDIVEVRTPLRWVWKEMKKRGLIIADLEKSYEQKWNYCKFHHEIGHEIQECTEFKTLVQGMIDNKETEFYEEVQEEGNICTSELTVGVPKANYPVVIISRPKNSEVRTCIMPKTIIQKPATFPYKDSKKVPWNYECNTTVPGKETSAATAEGDQGIGFHTHSGKRYDLINPRAKPTKEEASTEKQKREKVIVPEPLINKPIKEEKVKEFLKFLKHSEYSVVEQLHKQPASISVLALLLSFEAHRSALMEVLNEMYVANDISVNKLDRGSTKALHITTRCKGYMLSKVLIDNGSALNVLPLPTLDRLPVDSSHMKKLKLVSEGPLVTISAEEDIVATVTNNAPYVETDDEALGCSFQSLEFMNAMFIIEGDKILVPRISKTTKMGLQLMVGMRALPGRGLGRHIQGRVEALVLKDKFDRFGLGYRPDMKQKKKEMEKRQERRMARLSGKEVKWEPMTFPHISETFVSGGIIHPQRRIPVKESINEMLENVHIDAIHEDTNEEGTLLDIRPYEPGSVLNNWTAEEIPEVFRAFSESLDINGMSNSAMDPENPFERDMCLDGSQDFGDDIDSNLSPDMLRMIEQEEKQILPYKEVVEIVTLEEGKIVKMGTRITEETKQNLIELLQEFKDVFAWSYQNMLGLNTDIVVHHLPIKDDCKPVQQKLRRMRPNVVLKIKEEVQEQFDAGFLQVVKYSEWVANIVPVPKKDGKVMPFGLKNAGATYQRVMVTLFHDMMHKEVEVYIDDMIAKSQTEKEHVQVLRKLFLRLRKFQLKLKPAKCTFGTRSRKLLGFVVSEKGIEIDPDKVKAIPELRPPHTQKKVRGFLGRLNYIARFISQLTEKCDPIFRLVKKHNPGVWDEECQ